MTMSKLIYTQEQGKPSDVGLGDRWLREPLATTQFQPDNRPRTELIGEIIASIASEVAPEVAARALHSGLLSGLIKASGRFSASEWTDETNEVSLPFRARIPATEFAPAYESDKCENVTLLFDYEDNGWDNEWIAFDWSGSTVQYAAHGFQVDDANQELMSFTRWTVSWASIMVSRNEAMSVLSKMNPSLRPVVRPKPLRPSKAEEEIIAKADEMRLQGLNGTDIARRIKFESGFENVQNTQVRQLLAGRYRRGPRSNSQ